jgi:hypothetical protein
MARMLFTLRADLRLNLMHSVLRSAAASLASASSFAMVSGFTGVIFLVAMVLVPSRSVLPLSHRRDDGGPFRPVLPLRSTVLPGHGGVGGLAFKTIVKKRLAVADDRTTRAAPRPERHRTVKGVT